MTVEPSDEDGPILDDGAPVYSPLGASRYKGAAAAEKEAPVPSAVPTPNNQPVTIGAPPIRWGWWGLGLGISALLWLAVARVFGWF